MLKIDYAFRFNLDNFDTDHYKMKIKKSMKAQMLASNGNEMGPQGAQTEDFDYSIIIFLDGVNFLCDT